MPDKELDIIKSVAWSIIEKFCKEERQNKESEIMGIVKSDDCTINPGKTLADIKERVGQVKAFDKILELPEVLKKHLREKK
jgi:hypothetical protein